MPVARLVARVLALKDLRTPFLWCGPEARDPNLREPGHRVTKLSSLFRFLPFAGVSRLHMARARYTKLGCDCCSASSHEEPPQRQAWILLLSGGWDPLLTTSHVNWAIQSDYESQSLMALGGPGGRGPGGPHPEAGWGDACGHFTRQKLLPGQ